MPSEYDVRKELYERQHEHYIESINALEEGLQALLRRHEALDESITKVRADLSEVRAKLAVLLDVAKADGVTLDS